MISLKNILEQTQNGNFYDWTRDFDAFKNAINTTTENAKSRFEKSLSAKILNKSVVIRAAKSQPKQPVKDYTIQRVTGVNIVDYFDEWTVVLKNEANKEFCLVSGFKIKVLGSAIAAEPGSASAPQTATPPVQPQMAKPGVAQPRPNPKTQPQKPLGEFNLPKTEPSYDLQFLDNNFFLLSSRAAKELSVDGSLPKPGYQKKVNINNLGKYRLKYRKDAPPENIDVNQIQSAWIQETKTMGNWVWALLLRFK